MYIGILAVLLCRDLMAKNLKRAKRTMQKVGRHHELDFFPQTYTLPKVSWLLDCYRATLPEIQINSFLGIGTHYHA